MKVLFKRNHGRIKVLLIATISFLFGCMVAINLYPIERTCKLDDVDREYNIMNNEKLKNPDLIILILSAPQNHEKRQIIRDTWLKLQVIQPHIKEENAKFKLKHYFAIGSVGLPDAKLQELRAEQTDHSDMLILPIQDSYQNLTFKVLKSFSWLSDQVDYGLGFKYLLKCDDDSFVRLDHLAEELLSFELLYNNEKTQFNFEDTNVYDSHYMRVNVQANSALTMQRASKLGIYWGYFHGAAHVKQKGKWKEDDWILCDNYITYALGGGYILSRNLVQYIASNEDHLKLYNSEDVSVGAWLGTKNQLVRIHDIRFDTEWKSRGCQNFYLVTHPMTPDEMRTLYQNILAGSELCDTEKTQRKQYLYDWRAPPSQCCKTQH